MNDKILAKIKQILIEKEGYARREAERQLETIVAAHEIWEEAEHELMGEDHDKDSSPTLRAGGKKKIAKLTLKFWEQPWIGTGGGVHYWDKEELPEKINEIIDRLNEL